MVSPASERHGRVPCPKKYTSFCTPLLPFSSRNVQKFESINLNKFCFLPRGCPRPARGTGGCPARRKSTRKVDVRLPGKGNSNSHGARPVHLIITMIKWIQTSRLSIQNSLSALLGQVHVLLHTPHATIVQKCCFVSSSSKTSGIAYPHSGLRRGFRWLSHRKSVTLSIVTPLCPYPIAYRRAYG